MSIRSDPVLIRYTAAARHYTHFFVAADNVHTVHVYMLPWAQLADSHAIVRWQAYLSVAAKACPELACHCPQIDAYCFTGTDCLCKLCDPIHHSRCSRAHRHFCWAFSYIFFQKYSLEMSSESSASEQFRRNVLLQKRHLF